MGTATFQRCKNCGAEAPSKFCSECGQSTAVDVPTLRGLFHEMFAAILSYDSRLWRTLRVLVREPGQLTVAYLSGVRARYLSPFQLFVWLEALTFLVNHYLFDKDSNISNLKSRDLLLVGIGVALLLSLVNATKRRKVIESVVCASHLWSFLMLVLLFVYLLLPGVDAVLHRVAPHTVFPIGLAATYTTIAAMLVYVPPALMRVYQDKWWAALFKTLLIFALYVGLTIFFQTYIHPGIKV